MSCDEIDNGLVKSRDYQHRWFDLPTFRKLCRFTNDDLGLPDSKQAYYEACAAPSPKDRHHWSHAIVYLSGQSVGWWNINHEPETKAYPMFKHYYDVFVDRVRKGEKFKVQAYIAPQDDMLKISKERFEQERERFKLLKKELGR